MARKCGKCGQAGHNRKTCHVKISTIIDNDVEIESGCSFAKGQRIIVHFPWEEKPVIGVVDAIDAKANVYLHDEQTLQNHGFNWRTLVTHGIRVDDIAIDAKVSRRRRKVQTDNKES